MKGLSFLTVLGFLSTVPSGAQDTGIERPSGFRWRSAMSQSGAFLAIQHGFRLLTEPGTRTELKGPYFKDWGRSVAGLSGWGDGDPFIVNYVGHPMEGAVAGYIEVQNDPRGVTEEFGASTGYWKSRLRAMGFSAFYSAQFEVGPFSEASIGNVGKDGKSSGAVDLVVTPVAGLGWQVAEDAVDRYLVRWLEKRARRPVVKLLLRSTLNPSRSFANMLRGRVPWHRDTRMGVTALD